MLNIEVSDLLVKVLTLTHQHFNSSCKALLEMIDLNILHLCQLRVLFKQAECIK